MKSRLTPELSKKLCSYVRQGNWIETAAALCGVSTNSVRGWCLMGRRDIEGGRETDYAAFLEALETARAESESILLSRIVDASETDWKAAAWTLEKKNPRRFAAKTEPLPEVHEATGATEYTPEQARERWLEIGRAMGLSTETLALAAEQWRRDE